MLAWPGLALHMRMRLQIPALPAAASSLPSPPEFPPGSIPAYSSPPRLLALGSSPPLPLGSSLPLEPCRAGFSLTSKPRCSKTSTRS
jgi:hypothetical protein